VRQIEGYLPTTEVAFIDEIFKANSAILNALLTLLNERLFDNGNQRLRVPLLCLVGFPLPTRQIM
jgi:MoxR-like ATPase